MSSEESYLAILRYLTNEREPYAPGTEGNAKRKIRKAAACYVVRGGTLYYQRRQRDQQRFAELEVVLQAERRARLIRAAHLAPDGAHRTRLQTWQGLSQKYWWRGERGGAPSGTALPRVAVLLAPGTLGGSPLKGRLPLRGRCGVRGLLLGASEGSAAWSVALGQSVGCRPRRPRCTSSTAVECGCCTCCYICLFPSSEELHTQS